MQAYIQHCSRSRDDLLQRLGDRKYYMDHLELYSLRDLIAISEKGGEKFVKGLESTLACYEKHITSECPVSSVGNVWQADRQAGMHVCKHASRQLAVVEAHHHYQIIHDTKVIHVCMCVCVCLCAFSNSTAKRVVMCANSATAKRSCFRSKSRQLDSAQPARAISTRNATKRCGRQSRPAPNACGSQHCAIGKTGTERSVVRRRTLPTTGNIKTECLSTKEAQPMPIVTVCARPCK